MREDVVVVGGGVGGLTTALALARAGHCVTVLERDPLPAVAGPEEAFLAERRGAPHVHQTHGFLARIHVLLRDRFPDVFEQLLAAGCTVLPTTADLGEAQPGDEDLAVLIVRRTTLEWVLRQAVLAEPSVEIRTGAAVSGLVAAAPGNRNGDDGGPPLVTGVRITDGTTLDAGIVVAANGRRADLPGWLAALGVELPETVVESGLMYLSRWYRLPPALEIELDPKLGGDLGFVKYLAVPGDGDTLSITLAIRTDDADLRAALGDDTRFEQACRSLPGPSRFFAGAPLEAVGGVRPMGGLLNRLRTFVDGDGRPLVLGLHAVGDAHTCTNPLYGRGCSLAAVQAVLLADAVAAHPGDPTGRAASYEAACAEQVTPWYEVSVQMDRLGADPKGFAGLGATGSDGGGENPGLKALGAVFVAAATDPVIGRGLVRFWNLMATPADLMADGELLAHIAAVVAEPDRYPIPPREGPTRTELLATLDPRAA